jgi:hypothetical protein
MASVPRDDAPRHNPVTDTAWVLWSDSVWIAVLVLGLLLVARGLA